MAKIDLDFVVPDFSLDRASFIHGYACAFSVKASHIECDDVTAHPLVTFEGDRDDLVRLIKDWDNDNGEVDFYISLIEE